MGERGGLAQRGRLGGRVADEPAHAVLLEVGRDVAPAHVEEQLRVGHPHPVHRTAEDLRVPHQAHHRGIAAVGRAGQCHALRIGHALRHRPLRGVGQVVLHGRAPLLPAGAKVAGAEAGGAAELRLQHRVAARGEELHLRVPAPCRAPHPGPAMREDDQRQVLRLRARRQREVGRYLQAVARGNPHELRAAHLPRLDARVARAHAREAPRLPVPGQRHERLSVGPGLHQHPGRVAVLRHAQAVDGGLQLAVHGGLQALQRRVQPLRHLGVHRVAQPQNALAVADELREEVEALRAQHRLLRELAVGRIHRVKRQLVAGGGQRVQGAVRGHVPQRQALRVEVVEAGHRLPAAALGQLHRHAPVLARGDGPQAAPVVEEPVEAVHGGLDLRHAPGARVHALQLEVVHLVGADLQRPHHVDVVAAGQIGHAQERGGRVQRLARHRLRARLPEVAERLDELAHARAVAVHGEQAAPCLRLARTRQRGLQVEDQPAVVHPPEAPHGHVLEGRHHGGLHRLELQHREHRGFGRPLAADAQGHRQPVGRQRRRAQARVLEEGLQPGRGRQCRVGCGGLGVRGGCRQRQRRGAQHERAGLQRLAPTRIDLLDAMAARLMGVIVVTIVVTIVLVHGALLPFLLMTPASSRAGADPSCRAA